MNFPAVKECLSRLGAHVPPKAIHYANGVLNYLNVGRWLRDRQLKVPVRCADHVALNVLVSRQIEEPASFLEFGVFKGDSLRQWATLLAHPASVLHGFDSFEGLPESWGSLDRQHFNLKGVLPQFDDPRVALFKGWFSDTLPPYLLNHRPNRTLILHLDADLYSSTIFVLRQMRPLMVKGTILIFDEFWDREHELKAFAEFLAEWPFGIECLAATRALSQAAFRITSVPVPRARPSEDPEARQAPKS